MLITLGTLRVSVRHFNKALDSETRTTTRTRFSQYGVVRASVILAGKRGSHCHSATSFS